MKPENLLINNNGYLKLADFGTAKIIDTKTYTLCGTPEYIAPEIILSKGTNLINTFSLGHSKPVDWWSLGILLYEMLVGIDPFNSEDPMKVYQNILKGKVRFPKRLNSDAKSLIKHFLTADVSKRYGCMKNGVKDIFGHKLFKDLDWRSLLYSTMEVPFIPKIK